jgi:hypothetical protein
MNKSFIKLTLGQNKGKGLSKAMNLRTILLNNFVVILFNKLLCKHKQTFCVCHFLHN